MTTSHYPVFNQHSHDDRPPSSELQAKTIAPYRTGRALWRLRWRPDRAQATRCAALSFVSAPHISKGGAPTWLSAAGDDSVRILCIGPTKQHFACTWSAKLIQSYTGKADVTFNRAATKRS